MGLEALLVTTILVGALIMVGVLVWGLHRRKPPPEKTSPIEIQKVRERMQDMEYRLRIVDLRANAIQRPPHPEHRP